VMLEPVVNLSRGHVAKSLELWKSAPPEVSDSMPAGSDPINVDEGWIDMLNEVGEGFWDFIDKEKI